MKLELVTDPRPESRVAPLFVAVCTFEEKDAPKAAGFRWHGGGCRGACTACRLDIGRVWWTNKPACAARLIEYATPEAADALGGHVSAVQASRATAAEIDVPAPAGCAYLPYQRAGIAYAMARPSTLIGDEMGLGKTVQAIGVINADPQIKRVLVICPASLRINWRREMQKWLVRPATIELLDDEHPMPGDSDIVIANYDRARKPTVSAVLLSRAWDLLICDEAHRIKNPKTLQAKAILGVAADAKKGTLAIPGLVSQAARRLFLTGTPILNRPIEIQPLLAAIAPAEFGEFFPFAKRYCNAHKKDIGRGKTAWDFSGATRLEELQERLRATCMVRRLKDDVLTELPPKQRQIVELPCDEDCQDLVNAESAAYETAMGSEYGEFRVRDAAEDELDAASGDDPTYADLDGGELSSAQKLAFAQISKERHALALAKLPAVIEHVEDALESTPKIILFAHHKDVIAQLVTHFGDAAVSITGDTANEDRQVAVDRFQADPSVRLFVGSLMACREGLTLTAATTVIFAELDWVPANLSQAEDRAHRIGQTQHVLVQHLVLEGSLDARMVKTVTRKQRIADRALDADTAVQVSEAAKQKKAARQAREASYPQVSDVEKARLLAAMRTLAAACDGARELDGDGFSKVDAQVGRRLASMERLTNGQAQLAGKLALRYRRQLGATEIERLAGTPCPAGMLCWHEVPCAGAAR